MRYLYNVSVYLLLPLVILRLFWLSRRIPAYRQRLGERFGRSILSKCDKPVLWFHAVSVGEVLATRPLISRIQAEYPQYQLLVTTLTPTGSETVKKTYGDSVLHRYVPYDLPGAVERFVYGVRPKLLIVMETEIWPNLYRVCTINNVPVIIANARLSDKSFKGYSFLQKLARDTLKYTEKVFAQSSTDADRFLSLGLEKDKVTVAGNLKFDFVSLEPVKKKKSISTARRFTRNPVWIAASTHENEEQIILDAHKTILSEFPECLLILAPRHPQRFKKVAILTASAGFETILLSSHEDTMAKDFQVFIIDTLGDLPDYYAVSDIAYVGGSMVPAGGHNLLEPAALGVPVITGPHTWNFSDISDGLVNCNAARIVENEDALAQTIIALLKDKKVRNSMGHAGRQYIEKNQGCAEKILYCINKYLD